MVVVKQDDLEKKLSQYPKLVASYGENSEQVITFIEKQNKKIQDYIDGKLDIDAESAPVMQEFIDMFAKDEKTRVAASEKLANFLNELKNLEQTDQVTPDVTENQVHVIIEKKRKRSPYPDRNQEFIDAVSAAVFVDMGVISDADYKAANGKPDKVLDLLQSVPELNEKQQQEFSARLADRLVENDAWFDMLPPSILAKAYTEFKRRLDSADEKEHDALENRLQKVQDRMNQLTDEFAGKVGYWFADQTSVADIYDGYSEMFAVCKEYSDDSRKAVIDQNQSTLDECMKSFDDLWGLDSVDPERAEELEPRLDKLNRVLGKHDVSEETMGLAGKYKFLDKDGKPIPQFVDAQGNTVVDYSKGCVLDADGRLARVIDLAKHDVAKRHVAQLDEEINADALGKEADDAVLFKLFEIDTAGKVVEGALENPEQFTDPKYFESFVAELGQNGGQVTENGYQGAMDAQVNQTMGFAGRLKSKLKNASGKATGFFKKLFKPIEKNDRRAKDRFENTDKSTDRQKRIEFFKRMLTGFANAFLVSAAITVIATAAASLTGISVAASLAVIGVVTAIGVSAYQIHKWKKAQEKAGKPTDIQALLADGRMMASLGTSALGAIAMCFGAAGFAQAAMALGFGAMAVGGANNVVSTYQDAKQHGFSTMEALMWALGNAIAVVAGGIAGRTTANWGINQFNAHNPENTIFQNKEVTQQEQTVSREETRIVYKEGVTEHAREIAESWYRDNPAELQHRVEMIEQYNAENGTNIDPYRAIVLNADAGGQTFDNNALHVDGGGVKYSGGQHTVMTDAWARAHDVSPQELSALRNMFADGVLTSDEMSAAMKMDAMVSANNEVGYVDGRPAHYDGVLHQNTVDANGNPIFTTYTGGESVFENQTVVIQDTVTVDVVNYNPVDVPFGMGMFGQYFRKGYSKLKDRIGTFADKIFKTKKEIIEPEPPVPPVPPRPLPPRPEPKPLPPHIEPEPPVPPVPPRPLPPGPEPKPLPPHIEPEHDPVLRISRANAKILLDSPEIIERIQQGRHGAALSHRIAEHLKSKKKDAEQKVRTTKNRCAWSADRRATDEELAIAVEQVFLREELNGYHGEHAHQHAGEIGKYAELEKLEQRRKYITNDKDLRIWQFEYNKLVAEIKDLESRLIPDEYFVDAQEFILEYKRKKQEQGIVQYVQPAVIVEQEPVEEQVEPESVTEEIVDKEPEITNQDSAVVQQEPVDVAQEPTTARGNSKSNPFRIATVAVKDRKPRNILHIFKKAAKKVEENPRDVYRKMRKQKKKGMPVGYQTTSGNDM